MDLPSTGTCPLQCYTVIGNTYTVNATLELAFCSVTLNNTKWQCYIVTGSVTWAKLALARSHT